MWSTIDLGWGRYRWQWADGNRNIIASARGEAVS